MDRGDVLELICLSFKVFCKGYDVFFQWYTFIIEVFIGVLSSYLTIHGNV